MQNVDTLKHFLLILIGKGILVDRLVAAQLLTANTVQRFTYLDLMQLFSVNKTLAF